MLRATGLEVCGDRPGQDGRAELQRKEGDFRSLHRAERPLHSALE